MSPAKATFLEEQENAIKTYIQTTNDSTAPYHCNDHMFQMHEIAKVIYAAEVSKLEVGMPDSVDDRSVLMLAALFHDYRHSGGKYPDRTNIDRAADGLLTFTSLAGRHRIPVVSSAIGTLYAAEAVTAIRCTEFPFIHEPTTLVQKALRDADILYAAMTHDPAIILVDLLAEICISQKRQVTLQEMLTGQEVFISKAVLYTPTGKMLWDEHARTYLDEMRTYVEEHA